MFTKKDFDMLEDVFTLARLQSVNADPKNKQQLNALLSIEGMFNAKMTGVNEQLNFDETPKEAPAKVESELEVVAEDEVSETEEAVAQD